MDSVEYELDGAWARVTQLESRETRHQEPVDRTVRPTGQIRAGLHRVRVQKVEMLQVELIAYFISAFASVESPTMGNGSRLSHLRPRTSRALLMRSIS